MNLHVLIPAIELAMRMSDTLPAAGRFKSSADLVRLANRRVTIQSLYSHIYPQASHFKTSSIVDNKIHATLIEDSPPYRFSTVAKRYLHCHSTSNSHEYELFIPFTNNNAEFQLTGLLPLVAPGRMWEWTEYVFLTRNLFTNTENKVMLTINQERSQLPLTVDERYWLTRLERNALRYMDYCNITQVNETAPHDLYNLLLVRSWLTYTINIQSHNRYLIHDNASIKELNMHPWRQFVDFLLSPEQNQVKVIHPLWKSFFSFHEWATRQGYTSNKVLIPKEPTLSLCPDNAMWLTYQQVEKIQDYADSFWDLAIPDQYLFLSKLGLHSPLSPLKDIPYTHNGETKTISEWGEDTGIPYELLVVRAINELNSTEFLKDNDQPPIQYKYRIITMNGVSKTAQEWAIETGISLNTIISRIRYRWPETMLLNSPRNKRTPRH